MMRSIENVYAEEEKLPRYKEQGNGRKYLLGFNAVSHKCLQPLHGEAWRSYSSGTGTGTEPVPRDPNPGMSKVCRATF